MPARVAVGRAELDVAVLHARRRSRRPMPGLAPTPSLPGASSSPPAIRGCPHGPGRVRLRPSSCPCPTPDERAALRGTAAPGMSGGPVVDAQGEVVGMLLARGTPPHQLMALGQRLGFPGHGVAVMVPAPWLRAMASLAKVPAPPASQTRSSRP